MKKTVFLIFVLLISLSLFSCSKKEGTDSLEFPKTIWGMSPDDVLDSYGITKEGTSSYNEAGRGIAFRIDGYSLFGEESSYIIFNFIDFADNGTRSLCNVRAFYPESADMEHVLAEMKKAYGQTVPSVISYDLYQMYDELQERSYTESEQLKIWAKSPVIDMIPENELEDYGVLWEFFQPRLKEDNWTDFFQNARTVTVIWQDKEEGKSLDFNAYNLLVYNELKSRLSE